MKDKQEVYKTDEGTEGSQKTMEKGNTVEKQEEENKEKQAKAPSSLKRNPEVFGHHMMNDLAYFLHHPQMKGPQGPAMPPKKPKC